MVSIRTVTILLWAVVVIGVFAIGASSDPSVSVEVSASGDHYTYDYTVHNTGSVAVASFWLAFVNNTTLEASPPNWFGSLDAAIADKIIMWLPVDMPSLLPPGSTLSGFRIRSPLRPTRLQYTIVDIDGVFFRGEIDGPTSAGVSSAKTLPDDAEAFSLPAVVTGVFGDYYYIEVPDRCNGICVLDPGRALALGDWVTVAGHVGTSGSGERFIAATDVRKFWSLELSPLFLTTRSLGGSFVTGGGGLNNIGLLARTCGKFTYIDSHTFTVDDGSGVNLKCVVPDGVTLNQNWNYVGVTGISSCEPVGTELHRLLLVRTQNDILSY